MGVGVFPLTIVNVVPGGQGSTAPTQLATSHVDLIKSVLPLTFAHANRDIAECSATYRFVLRPV